MRRKGEDKLIVWQKEKEVTKGASDSDSKSQRKSAQGTMAQKSTQTKTAVETVKQGQS